MLTPTATSEMGMSKGKRPRGVPLGKRRGANGQVVDDPLEVAAMRVAYRLRERKLSYDVVADILNELGFLNRSDMPYTALGARALAQRYAELLKGE